MNPSPAPLMGVTVAAPLVNVKPGGIVVLVDHGALGDAHDMASLIATLSHPSVPVRALVRVADDEGLSFARTLRQAGISTQLLLAPSVPPPDDTGPMARLPPGSTTADLDDMCLALSDAVIAVPSAADRDSVRDLLARAAASGKPVCPPGCKLHCVVGAASRSVADGLDPRRAGWHAIGRSWSGRLEQMVLEALACGWRGRADNGWARSRKRLHECLLGPWTPEHYFAPDDWRAVVPDAAAADAASPLVERFETLDRCALYGSYVHRDLIWLAHLAGAFAVLLAVAGSLAEHASLWNRFSMVAELVLLLLIAGCVGVARQVELQDRWTACRLGAEQLRIARMCLPLLVVPPALKILEGPTAAASGRDFTADVLAEVRRTVRDQGLPQLPPDHGPARAAAWLKLIVDDQTVYHERNCLKLEHAERRLRGLTIFFFVAAVVAVVLHFFVAWEALLLLTAAGPAFVAALHGAGTRLGIVHRTGLSEDVHRDLAGVGAKLDAFLAAPPAVPETAWAQLRALARSAADAMGHETMSWRKLLRRERDDLPA